MPAHGGVRHDAGSSPAAAGRCGGLEVASGCTRLVREGLNVARPQRVAMLQMRVHRRLGELERPRVAGIARRDVTDAHLLLALAVDGIRERDAWCGYGEN